MPFLTARLMCGVCVFSPFVKPLPPGQASQRGRGLGGSQGSGVWRRRTGRCSRGRRRRCAGSAAGTPRSAQPPQTPFQPRSSPGKAAAASPGPSRGCGWGVWQGGQGGRTIGGVAAAAVPISSPAASATAIGSHGRTARLRRGLRGTSSVPLLATHSPLRPSHLRSPRARALSRCHRGIGKSRRTEPARCPGCWPCSVNVTASH